MAGIPLKIRRQVVNQSWLRGLSGSQPEYSMGGQRPQRPVLREDVLAGAFLGAHVGFLGSFGGSP